MKAVKKKKNRARQENKKNICFSKWYDITCKTDFRFWKSLPVTERKVIFQNKQTSNEIEGEKIVRDTCLKKSSVGGTASIASCPLWCEKYYCTGRLNKETNCTALFFFLSWLPSSTKIIYFLFRVLCTRSKGMSRRRDAARKKKENNNKRENSLVVVGRVVLDTTVAHRQRDRTHRLEIEVATTLMLSSNERSSMPGRCSDVHLKQSLEFRTKKGNRKQKKNARGISGACVVSRVNNVPLCGPLIAGLRPCHEKPTSHADGIR